MNTMVVSVMNASVHASIKALQGYCFFHRMLLAIVDRHPHLKQVIETRIKNFIVKPDCRHKKEVPSLGDFLPLLTVSNYSWHHLATPVLRETFVRNVLWISKANKDLGLVDPEYDSEKEQVRAQKSFATAQVSLRLLMFHVYFLCNVANRQPGQTLQTLADIYDSRYGLPTEEQQQALQDAVFDLQKVQDYNGFFEKVHLPLPSERVLHDLLRQCVNESYDKKYHNPYYTPRKVKAPKEKGRPTLNMEDEY